jgi:hypothetical protein
MLTQTLLPCGAKGTPADWQKGGGAVPNLGRAVSDAQRQQHYNADSEEQDCDRHGIVFEPTPSIGKHGIPPTEGFFFGPDIRSGS